MSDLVFYCEGPYNFIFWQKGQVVNRLFICKEILNNGVDKLDPFLTWDRSYLWTNKVCLHTQCPWEDAIVSPQVEIVSISGPTSPLHFFAHANNIIPITFSRVYLDSIVLLLLLLLLDSESMGLKFKREFIHTER